MENEENKIIKKLRIQTIILLICIIILFIMVYRAYDNYIISTQSDILKPIIYIYPEKEQEVVVSLSNPEKLTTTYPKYNSKWQVTAKPDGTLIDKETGRQLYSLYWEGSKASQSNISTGFVIKGEETAKFLEEKLDILGLNEREAEEFIIFWLPKMEHNPYNFIHFKTMEEINDYMSLNITPKPETLIRVMMEFKALDKPIQVEKQELIKVERKGYTVVEWGGTEIP